MKVPLVFRQVQLGALSVVLALTVSCSGGGSDNIDGGSETRFGPPDTLSDGQPYTALYNEQKACSGLTLLPDHHDPGAPRIIEIDMWANIVWSYELPENLRQYIQPGLDAERLNSGNILVTLPGYGVMEIDRQGNIVWSHQDPYISHDADRLPDGNTIYSFGGFDQKTEPVVTEVDYLGNIVWRWYAGSQYDRAPYADIFREGWTHANAVERLSNGNTLVSLRNFTLTVELDPSGSVVWQRDWTGTGLDPHEPELHQDDTLLVCLQKVQQNQAYEIDRSTGEAIWSYSNPDLRTPRDCDRLANGNTLIVAVHTGGTWDYFEDDDSMIIEVTPSGEIVWELRLKNQYVGQSPGNFYKAQRSCG